MDLNPATLTTPAHSGGRFTLGYWFTDSHSIGFEGGYFFLGGRSNSQIVTGYLDLGPAPGFNPSGRRVNGFATDPQAVELNNSSELQGPELNFMSEKIGSDALPLTLLVGAAFLQLEENLSATVQNNIFPIFSFPSLSLNNIDRYATRNNFYGGQLGAIFQHKYKDWRIEASAKIALGEVHQKVEVQAIRSNSILGDFMTDVTTQTRDLFGVVPEISAGVGYQLTSNLSAFVNYNFLYMNSVAPPGDQTFSITNVFLIGSHGLRTGAALTDPQISEPTCNNSNFWAQGLEVGLRYVMP